MTRHGWYFAQLYSYFNPCSRIIAVVGQAAESSAFSSFAFFFLSWEMLVTASFCLDVPLHRANARGAEEVTRASG
jgi:hypothetical protein